MSLNGPRSSRGYAIVLEGDEVFGADLHFIRTTHVPGSVLQDCIECRCVDADPPLHPKGQVSCCPDGTQCYGMANSTLHDAKDYFLQYTVGYEPATRCTVVLSSYVCKHYSSITRSVNHIYCGVFWYILTGYM